MYCFVIVYIMQDEMLLWYSHSTTPTICLEQCHLIACNTVKTGCQAHVLIVAAARNYAPNNEYALNKEISVFLPNSPYTFPPPGLYRMCDGYAKQRDVLVGECCAWTPRL